MDSRTAKIIVSSAAVTAATLLLGQRLLKKRHTLVSNRSQAEKEITQEEHEIWREQLSRNRQFFGDDGQNRVEKAFVVVVGLGGVGSACAMALARNGVQNLKLIDFDQVTLSSLNRHACATRKDVGLSKCHVLRDAILALNPNARVELVQALFRKDVAEVLLYMDDGSSIPRKPDFVVDCIDNVASKTDLIIFCKTRNFPIISSGGAGGKCDPSKVCIADISDTVCDELARSIRKQLRERGITRGVPFCYSSEHYGRELLPLKDFQQNQVDEFRPFETFRVRIVPVLGTLPAVFGYTLASYVLCHLASESLDIDSISHEISRQINTRTFKRLFVAVKHFASEFGKKKADVNLELSYVDTYDVYVNVCHGKSILSGRRKNLDGLQIVPWANCRSSLQEALTAPNNAVCVTKIEAKHHLQEIFGKQKPLSAVYTSEQLAYVQERLKKPHTKMCLAITA